MTYLIIAKADENNRPTHINQKETQIEADAVVAQLHTNGDTDAFAIETPHARKDPRYMTVDFAAKTVTYDQVAEDEAKLELNWKSSMQGTDSGMSRTMEDILDGMPDKSGVAQITLDKLQAKKDLRATKP